MDLLNFDLKVFCDQKAVLKSDFTDPDFMRDRTRVCTRKAKIVSLTKNVKVILGCKKLEISM